MLIVSVHPYCARKFTRQVMHRAHAKLCLDSTVLDVREYFPFDGSFSLPNKSLNFLQNAPSYFVPFISSFIRAALSNAS